MRSLGRGRERSRLWGVTLSEKSQCIIVSVYKSFAVSSFLTLPVVTYITMWTKFVNVFCILVIVRPSLSLIGRSF